MAPHRKSRVQQEIRQTRPFRSVSQEAVIALWRTADQLRLYFGGVTGREGITLQQYNVLRILRGAGPDGLPTLEVAGRMIEHAPGITRMIDRLEARGWVTRGRSATDRRQVHCAITPDGLALLARLDGSIDDADDHAFDGLSRAELEQLIATLDAVRVTLQDRVLTTDTASMERQTT